MAAIIGPHTGGLVVARADQLWQLQMVRGTMYGSQNWSRTIRGCHPPGPLVGGTSLRVTVQPASSLFPHDCNRDQVRLNPVSERR